MKPNPQNPMITPERIHSYALYLREQEKSHSTVERYTCALKGLLAFLREAALTREALLEWKESLLEHYAAASVNLMLAAVNGYLDFCGFSALRLRPLRIQRPLFCSEDKELTRNEYTRLVRAAETQGNRRLSLVLQTLCSTGIRVSELRFITLEAAKTGRAEVNNKGKRRSVLLPVGLCRILRKYAGQQKRTVGPVFITKNGKPLDRSNIWRDMKALCETAGVNPEKVFPHNLRHLFARTYYTLERDLSRLADLLGHASVNTTRIYTLETGVIHAKQLERLGLLIT